MRHLLMLGTCGIILSPVPALAVNASIATALPALAGEARTQSVTLDDIVYYSYRLDAGRSYAAFCWSPTKEGTATDATGATINCNLALQSYAGSTLVTGQFSADPIVHGGEWLAYTPLTGGNYFLKVHSNTTGTVRLLLVETTLFSPWYFVSPASGYESYVEIKNNTSRAVVVTVSAYTPAGGPVGAITRTISANGSTYVRVGADLGAPAGTSGGIQITYDAPPGSVTANVTTLSGVTGLSFDAPAVPRMAFSNFS